LGVKCSTGGHPCKSEGRPPALNAARGWAGLAGLSDASLCLALPGYAKRRRCLCKGWALQGLSRPCRAAPRGARLCRASSLGEYPMKTCMSSVRARLFPPKGEFWRGELGRSGKVGAASGPRGWRGPVSRSEAERLCRSRGAGRRPGRGVCRRLGRLVGGGMALARFRARTGALWGQSEKSAKAASMASRWSSPRTLA
jgi:hypothetical protein